MGAYPKEEENGKLLISEDSQQDGKIATKKTLLDDKESKALKQSDAHQISNLKENVEGVQAICEEVKDAESKEDKDKCDDITSLQKMQTEETQKTEALTLTERSTDDDKENLDDSARGKSADLSSTESRVSTLNVEESFSPERTGSPGDKKSEHIERDDEERLETKAGKLPK